MILVDPRDGNTVNDQQASMELVRYIRARGVMADRFRLDSGDLQFEGNSLQGRILVGIERKTLHDLLHCIDDGRLNQQRISMAKMYAVSILMVEGVYRESREGYLLQGFVHGDGYKFKLCDYRQRPVLYSKLRYLMSIALTGMIVCRTSDILHTALEACEWYNYFQNPDHTSMLAIQKPIIPAADGRPTLTRKWAHDIEGVGLKYSAEAQKIFKTPYDLARSDESDWLRIDGIGVPTAQDIVRQIHGWDRRGKGR